jgi:hypothetical protein
LLLPPERRKLQCMTELPNHRRLSDSQKLSIVCGLLVSALSLLAPHRSYAEPTPQAVATFNSYVEAVEARLSEQHLSQGAFLGAPALASQNAQRLRSGEQIIEELTPPPPADLPGALLHHWRGAAFAPGAKAADFERMLRDFSAYPQRFAPQVLQAKVFSQHGDSLLVAMRVRQKHILTVVLDATYDVAFGRLNAQDGYSTSRSTSIYEIDAPGTSREHRFNADEEHGFLWRLNTYWTYEERDGGLYIQIESVSLSRSIPTGLGWAIRPFVESVPRESLEFTLRSACNAVRK